MTQESKKCGFAFEINHDGSVQMGRPGSVSMHRSVRVGGKLPGGIDSDRLAWESSDADPLIKIDVLPFCFKCN